MKTTLIRLALAAACLAPLACSESASPASTSSAVQGEANPTYESVVGTWQFVYDEGRRKAVETELAKEIHDPAKLAEAKKEAEDEAAASQIELTADHVYISRIGSDELMREGFTAAPSADGHSLELTRTSWLKRVGLGAITVKVIDKDAIVMVDPKKGDLLFRRVR